MSAPHLAVLRRRVRAGELPEELIAELRSVVARVVHLRLLPPSFSPTGNGTRRLHRRSSAPGTQNAS